MSSLLFSNLGSESQIGVGLLTLTLVLILSIFYQPLESKDLNTLQSISTICLILTMYTLSFCEQITSKENAKRGLIPVFIAGAVSPNLLYIGYLVYRIRKTKAIESSVSQEGKN